METGVRLASGASSRRPVPPLRRPRELGGISSDQTVIRSLLGGGMPETAGSDDERRSRVGRQSGETSESKVYLAPHRLRLLAFLIDVLFFLGVVVVGYLAGKFYGWLAWLLWVVAAATFVYYVAATVWLMDQTLGKAMTGLRVRRIDGSAPSRSFRGLAWSVGRHTAGYLIADVLLLGSIAAFFTRRRRCPHDYAFGSEVVLVASAKGAKPLAARYQEFWEVFSKRYEETQEEYRWVFWPWKWLIRVMTAIAALLIPYMAKAGSTAAHSATTAVSAKRLSITGKAALWVGGSVATGASVAALVTSSRIETSESTKPPGSAIDTCALLSRGELSDILMPLVNNPKRFLRAYRRERIASGCEWKYAGHATVRASQTNQDIGELVKTDDNTPLTDIGDEAVFIGSTENHAIVVFRKHSVVMAVDVFDPFTSPLGFRGRGFQGLGAEEIARLLASRF